MKIMLDWRPWLLLFTAALILVACAQAPATPAPEQAAPATEAAQESSDSSAKPQKFVYVSPDPLGVNEFLIMGQTGLEKVGDKYSAQTKVLESEDPTTREENVRAAVSDGATIVIVLGFEFNDILPKVAAESPDVQFLIVDQCIENPPANVHCAVFREYEAAFLIGAVAASLSETGHVGAIGALDIPFMHRYTDGFAAGAKHIKPDIEVSTLWVGGDNPFSDPARAKEQALAMAADGADHIFAATAAGNLGIFEAAQEQDFFTYGVDVNQCPIAPGHVVENLIKRVDVAIEESVDKIMSGEAQENVLVYGVADKGIGLVALTTDQPEDSQCVIMEHPDLITQIQEIQQQIVSGEITIEDPMMQTN